MDTIVKYHELGLGLFVHFGLYSIIGKGEWVKFMHGIKDVEYEKLLNKFNPRKDWADKICEFAKKNGFKYVVLTSRHHDGFSLYDVKGLNEYDSLHSKCKRDLAQEFVNACRKYDLKPFFYHTLIDWREEKNHKTFSSYLKYLRRSIEILCKNYGELGGIWLDGYWKYPDADWEDDKFYAIIKKYQPNAMIINNSGLDDLGHRINKYVTGITFERHNMESYDYFKHKEEYAAEMCQTLNSYWGYAENDINYKSISELVDNIVVSREHGGNLLLNIGPERNGKIRGIDYCIIDMLGKWININKEALYLPKPININNSQRILKHGDTYYIFVDPFKSNDVSLKIKGKIKSIIYLDSGLPVEYEQSKTKVSIKIDKFKSGTNYLIRTIKITVTI